MQFLSPAYAVPLLNPTLTMQPTPEFQKQAVLDTDPWLEPFVPAIEHRHGVFRNWRNNILQHEGGYDKFTKGYDTFGLNVQPDNSIVYREWAPGVKEANLIGDFSEFRLYEQPARTATDSARPTLDDWNRISHPLKRNEYGVWEMTIPPTADGEPAIPHDSKIKVRCSTSFCSAPVGLNPAYLDIDDCWFRRTY